MLIRFWGVRGTIPTPGPDTVKIGGNTSCVEVITSDRQRIIIDAGSGIRLLGKKLLKESPNRILST
ncbi:MAG: MBL fold metallo-hydrolase, partial [Anaerolineae bacterium]